MKCSYSACADIAVMFETGGIGQTLSLLECYLVFNLFICKKLSTIWQRYNKNRGSVFMQNSVESSFLVCRTSSEYLCLVHISRSLVQLCFTGAKCFFLLGYMYAESTYQLL